MTGLDINCEDMTAGGDTKYPRLIYQNLSYCYIHYNKLSIFLFGSRETLELDPSKCSL